jgi:hypothetical protein
MLAIHTLWGAPVLIVVIVGLLYQQLGWATFVGLVVVAIYSPISSEYLVCRMWCQQAAMYSKAARQRLTGSNAQRCKLKGSSCSGGSAVCVCVCV